MAYSKLPKVIQDTGLGYQSINQANDNNAQLREAYAEGHGPFAGGGVSSIWSKPGQHDNLLICRTVIRIYQATYVITPEPMVLAAGPGMPAVGGWILGGGGRYSISVALDNLKAIITAEQPDSSAVRIPRWNYTVPATGVQTRGLDIWLWEESAGEFSLAAYDFEVLLWGTPFA